MDESKKNIKIYLFIIIILSVLYYIICFFTHGKYFDSVFFGDHNDTFADFFKCVYGWHGNPFEENIGNYPAIAMIFYKVAYMAIPNGVYVDNGLQYRAESSIWIVFILYNIFVIWVSWISIDKMSNLSVSQKKLLSIALLLSTPVMFSLERGNQVNLAFALTFFFAAYYNDQRRYMREISLICLALAASLKIYPAVYGFILLKERKWKETGRIIIYGGVLFFFPFLFYGKNAFRSFIKCLFKFSEGHTMYAYNFSIKNIVRAIVHVCGGSIPDALCDKIWIIFLAFLFIVILMAKKDWKLWGALTFILIWVPAVSDTYVMSFMIIPFVMLLNEVNVTNEKYKKSDLIAMFMFMMLFVPFALPSIEKEGGYILSYTYIIYFITTLGIEILIVYQVLKEWRMPYHKNMVEQ